MRRLTALIVAALAAVAACIATGAPPSAAPPTAPIEASRNATASVASASVVPSPSGSGETTDPPPSLVLSAGDAGAHDGRVGGWTWLDHGDASPFLPARILPSIEIAAGTPLEARLGDGTQVTSWTAAYARAEDEAGINLVELGRDENLIPPIDTIAFPAPPPGDWVLEVSVWYSDNRGSGAYYWHLIVVE